MNFFGTVGLRVSPEALITQAGEVQKKVNDMRKRFQQLEEKISATSSYWKGDAANVHRKLYAEQQDEVDKILKRLAEHPDNLLKISGNYTAAETTNTETAATLDVDIIS